MNVSRAPEWVVLGERMPADGDNHENAPVRSARNAGTNGVRPQSEPATCSSSRTKGAGAAIANNANVASRIRRCWARSRGAPSVCPGFRRVNVARGGAVGRTEPGFHEVRVVDTPESSRARASSPTDCEHIGQEGTRRAASHPCAFTCSTMAGIISSRTRIASG